MNQKKRKIFFVIFWFVLLIFLFFLKELFFSLYYKNASWDYWALFSVLSFISLWVIYFCFYEKKEKKEDSFVGDYEKLKKDFYKFEKDIKKYVRVHIKMSLHFWIHYYKKEKVVSLQSAKKTIFSNLKKEFSKISWMSAIIEDVYKEISRNE